MGSMGMKNYLLSFEGRIGRGGFWMFWLVYLAVLTVLVTMMVMSVASSISVDAAGVPMVKENSMAGVLNIVLTVFYLVTLWPMLAVSAKRWHDRDKSGWWTLISLVPIIGLWMLIECGFFKGTRGPNRFGDDPSQVGLHQPAMDQQMHGMAGE